MGSAPPEPTGDCEYCGKIGYYCVHGYYICPACLSVLETTFGPIEEYLDEK